MGDHYRLQGAFKQAVMNEDGYEAQNFVACIGGQRKKKPMNFCRRCKLLTKLTNGAQVVDVQEGTTGSE